MVSHRSPCLFNSSHAKPNDRRKLSKLTNHRVYKQLVYQKEVLKTMFTGSLVRLSPVLTRFSRNFFPEDANKSTWQKLRKRASEKLQLVWFWLARNLEASVTSGAQATCLNSASKQNVCLRRRLRRLNLFILIYTFSVKLWKIILRERWFFGFAKKGVDMGPSLVLFDSCLHPVCFDQG